MFMTSQRTTRFQIYRLFRIVREIQKGKFPNCEFLAGLRDFELSRRTVLRDIDCLRRLGAPLEFDRSRNGYCLTGDFQLMPPLDLGHEDVFTLHFLLQSIAAYEHTDIGRSMKTSFHRIFTILMGPHAWKKVAEADDISRAVSNFRADGSGNDNG